MVFTLGETAAASSIDSSGVPSGTSTESTCTGLPTSSSAWRRRRRQSQLYCTATVHTAGCSPLGSPAITGVLESQSAAARATPC